MIYVFFSLDRGSFESRLISCQKYIYYRKGDSLVLKLRVQTSILKFQSERIK